MSNVELYITLYIFYVENITKATYKFEFYWFKYIAEQSVT